MAITNRIFDAYVVLFSLVYSKPRPNLRFARLNLRSTSQLPTLMSGNTFRGLTVVISPLLSLMKDQVGNLSAKGIADAVTVNVLLDPVERASTIERVQNGQASLLYSGIAAAGSSGGIVCLEHVSMLKKSSYCTLRYCYQAHLC